MKNDKLQNMNLTAKVLQKSEKNSIYTIEELTSESRYSLYKKGFDMVDTEMVVHFLEQNGRFLSGDVKRKCTCCKREYYSNPRHSASGICRACHDFETVIIDCLSEFHDPVIVYVSQTEYSFYTGPEGRMTAVYFILENKTSEKIELRISDVRLITDAGLSESCDAGKTEYLLEPKQRVMFRGVWPDDKLKNGVVYPGDKIVFTMCMNNKPIKYGYEYSGLRWINFYLRET